MAKIVLENQFGEVSENDILAGSTPFPQAPIAAHTVVANNTGSSAEPTAVPNATLANALPYKTAAANTVIANNTGGSAAATEVPYATLVAALPNKIIAANSLLANLTGGSAAMTAVTEQALSNHLPAKAGVTALTPIADPSTATAEDCANAINALLAALKVVS